MRKIRDIILQNSDCCRKTPSIFCNDAGNQGKSSYVRGQFFYDDDKEYDICSNSGKIT